MEAKKICDVVIDWLKKYHKSSKTNGFVVGISGGIDSAVTSTLCALTGAPVVLVEMPIYQGSKEVLRSSEHINWLTGKFKNVSSHNVDLTFAFDKIGETLPSEIQDALTMANARSRLRMLTLYAFAGNKKMLVIGTGNKVEDFGIGFFTKYGDGGVDLSPIANLSKSEVFALAKELEIIDSIQKAKPTDGLFDDDRSDEDQIGASYPELEWAMSFDGDQSLLTERELEVLKIYNAYNTANKHKMLPIPVCEIPKDLK